MEQAAIPSNREQLLTLLRRWKGYVAWAYEVHSKRQHRYYELNFALGLPIALLSMSVGGGSVALFGETIEPIFRVLGAVFSLTAAALAAIQTFIKPSEQAKEHQIAAAGYADLERDIDQLIASPPDKDEELEQEVTKFNERLNKLDNDSPALPPRTMPQPEAS